MPSHFIALGNEWDDVLNVRFKLWANISAVIPQSPTEFLDS